MRWFKVKKTLIWLAVLIFIACFTVFVIAEYQFVRMHAARELSLKRLDAIAHALKAYAKQHHGTLPDMSNASVVAIALKPYIADPNVLRQPLTQQSYRPNPVLSHRQWNSFSHPYIRVVAFYEEKPDPKGFRCILYLDGDLYESTYVSKMTWSWMMSESHGTLINLP